MVTFPAGVTRASFTIPVYDNNVYEEDNKEFVLIISASSLPSGVIAGSPSRAIVTIRNNDRKHIHC